MALEFVGEVALGIARAMAEAFAEVLIRGVGHLICQPFSRRIDAEGVTVLLAGIAFWVAVAAGLWWLWAG